MKFLNALLWIWQLPQHLLAIIIYLILIISKKIVAIDNFLSSKVYWANISWGVSLGNYIFLGGAYSDGVTVKHEYGHSIQSKIFGPLYLLIIGLPSITMNILSVILFYRGNKKFYKNYYNRWPESQADKLGKVENRPPL